jgi:hypothetical protein
VVPLSRIVGWRWGRANRDSDFSKNSRPSDGGRGLKAIRYRIDARREGGGDQSERDWLLWAGEGRMTEKCETQDGRSGTAVQFETASQQNKEGFPPCDASRKSSLRA